MEAVLAKNSSLKIAWEDSVKTHTTQIQNKKNFIAQCAYFHDVVMQINVISKKDPAACP